MEINPYIFREYDIRGVVEKDFQPEISEILGKTIATHLKNSINAKNIIIGRDCRLSSPSMKENIIKGLVSTGIDVIDIGVVPTPVFYFAGHYLKADGGVMITGSHNPPEYNGIKITKHRKTIFGDEIRSLLKIIEKGDFVKGKGKIKEKNITDAYINTVKNKIKTTKKQLKIAIDCGNGTAGPLILPLLKSFNCETIELFCEPDGRFPNHFPDPIVVKNLETLIKKVKEEKADFGIAFDGDADRLGIVDDRGEVIWGDILLLIFARDILKKKPKSKIIFEVKCSEALSEDILKHNGIPVMWKTGHSLIENKIHQEKSPLGGEMSGHFFFYDNYYGYDDAIFTACRLVEIMQHTEKKLSEIIATIPKYYNSPEMRIECADEIKFKVVDDIKNYYKEKGYKIIDIDGARIYFESGWALIRASNTQPVLVLRFESKTEEGLKEISEGFLKSLEKFIPLETK